MRYDAFSHYHPVVNFIFFVGAIACCVLIQHPAYLIAGLFAAASYYFCLRGRSAWKLLFGLLPVFLLVSAINPLFNTSGEHILFHLFGRPYTLEALCYGMVTAAMFVSTILWFCCYNAVMTSDKFTSWVGNLHLSLLLVMILRMIPSLAKKLRQIAGARRSIGMGSEKQDSLRQKVISGICILSAVTDHALDGSIVTADSMRARGYGTGRRTNFQLYRMRTRDTLLLLLEAVLLLLLILFGKTAVSFTPRILIQNISWSFACYCAFMLLPTILHVKEAIQWRISISRI